MRVLVTGIALLAAALSPAVVAQATVTAAAAMLIERESGDEATHGDAPLVWDAFVIVDGQLRPDGRVRTCPQRGDERVEAICLRGGLIKEHVGRPVALSLQAMLDRELAATSPRTRGVVVGPAPVWRGRFGEIDRTRLLIYYRIAGRRGE